MALLGPAAADDARDGSPVNGFCAVPTLRRCKDKLIASDLQRALVTWSEAVCLPCKR